MDAVLLCVSFTAFALGLVVVLSVDVALNPRGFRLVAWFTAAVALVACVLVGSQVDSSRTFDQVLLETIRQGKPKEILLTASAFVTGFSIGLLSIFCLRSGKSFWFSLMISGMVSVSTGSGLLLVWDLAFDIERFRPLVNSPTHIIEEIAQTEHEPIRLAFDEANQQLYYCTYSTGINGVFNGSVFRLDMKQPSLPMSSELSISSVFLYRPFGMSFFNDELFVSRAGHAAHGRVTERLPIRTMERSLD